MFSLSSQVDSFMHKCADALTRIEVYRGCGTCCQWTDIDAHATVESTADTTPQPEASALPMTSGSAEPNSFSQYGLTGTRSDLGNAVTQSSLVQTFSSHQDQGSTVVPVTFPTTHCLTCPSSPEQTTKTLTPQETIHEVDTTVARTHPCHLPCSPLWSTGSVAVQHTGCGIIHCSNFAFISSYFW